MSISIKNLSVIIVSFKSDNVIHDCIKSINEQIKIIVIDNSNNKQFKENIESRYKNVECILSSSNLGMGSGNNLGIKNVKTDYAFILNPDVILEIDTIDKIIQASKKIEKFSIIAPISTNKGYPNYKLLNKTDIFNHDPLRVKTVDGYAMLINLKNLKSIKNFYFFDKNFFLYLENDDLCKRLNDLNQNIYIVPTSKIYHLGGKAVDEKYNYEIELSRNWHWIWSKFYFNKKHYGFIVALLSGLPTFFSSVSKFFLYLLLRNHKKKNIYLKRLLGFINALIGKPSYYRPKINN